MEDFLTLRWTGSGVTGRSSESSSAPVLRDEYLEGLGFFVVADFFDDLVDFELAKSKSEQIVRE